MSADVVRFTPWGMLLRQDEVAMVRAATIEEVAEAVEHIAFLFGDWDESKPAEVVADIVEIIRGLKQ